MGLCLSFPPVHLTYHVYSVWGYLKCYKKVCVWFVCKANPEQGKSSSDCLLFLSFSPMVILFLSDSWSGGHLGVLGHLLYPHSLFPSTLFPGVLQASWVPWLPPSEGLTSHNQNWVTIHLSTLDPVTFSLHFIVSLCELPSRIWWREISFTYNSSFFTVVDDHCDSHSPKQRCWSLCAQLMLLVICFSTTSFGELC